MATFAAALPERLGETQELRPRRAIPFDYAFRFDLKGEPGSVINQTVTVSVEATFVAVSVGYGVIPTVTPIIFGLKPRPPVPPPVILTAARSTPPTLSSILGELVDSLEEAFAETGRGEIGPQVATALSNGFKLNPNFADRVLLAGRAREIDSKILPQLFQVVAPPIDQIEFLYALFDEGSGREFQSEPILNVAGLGISNGDRPFRYFAQPISFAPRSTIRMEVREVSDFKGELHVALHGYKVLGAVGTPTGQSQAQRQRRRGRTRQSSVVRMRRR